MIIPSFLYKLINPQMDEYFFTLSHFLVVNVLRFGSNYLSLFMSVFSSLILSLYLYHYQSLFLFLSLSLSLSSHCFFLSHRISA